MMKKILAVLVLVLILNVFILSDVKRPPSWSPRTPAPLSYSISDVRLFCQSWLSETKWDGNGDGVANFIDYAILLEDGEISGEGSSFYYTYSNTLMPDVYFIAGLRKYQAVIRKQWLNFNRSLK